jgi:hypothetical protein
MTTQLRLPKIGLPQMGLPKMGLPQIGLPQIRMPRRKVAPIMSALVLCLCSAHAALAQKVEVQFDQAANFKQYKTFAIRDGELNSKNAALNSELTKKEIEADIAKYLTTKGLQATTGPSDLNVRYHFGSARKVETEAYPAGWYGLRTRYVRVPYSEGTLVIDLRDPSTKSLVWRAIASQDKDDPTKLAGKLGDMVKKSIEKYPPKGK